MFNKIRELIFFIALAFCSCNSVYTVKKATRIAEKKWVEKYDQSILEFKPYNIALLGDSIWVVTGSLPPSGWNINQQGDSTLTIITGGVPVIKIRKNDGAIIENYHTR